MIKSYMFHLTIKETNTTVSRYFTPINGLFDKLTKCLKTYSSFFKINPPLNLNDVNIKMEINSQHFIEFSELDENYIKNYIELNELSCQSLVDIIYDNQFRKNKFTPDTPSNHRGEIKSIDISVRLMALEMLNHPLKMPSSKVLADVFYWCLKLNDCPELVEKTMDLWKTKMKAMNYLRYHNDWRNMWDIIEYFNNNPIQENRHKPHASPEERKQWSDLIDMWSKMGYWIINLRKELASLTKEDKEKQVNICLLLKRIKLCCPYNPYIQPFECLRTY